MIALGALAGPAPAAFAPLDRPGPKLTVPRELLRASLRCSAGVRSAARAPVLLLPATTVDSQHNFSWNYMRLFAAEGIPYCASDQQGNRMTNMADIQVRGMYMTYAIRRMYRIAGRRISILGHSQGGMAMRLALRFWPDTRAMVDDVIGFAGTNHGSEAIRLVSCFDGCSAAFAQQRDDARLIRALNSRQETFAPISYTEVFTNYDEVVTPPAAASSVSGPGKITHVAVQEICPFDVTEHLNLGTTDPVAAALALDALAHPGPAQPGRISPAVCTQLLMPGIDPFSFLPDFTSAAAQLADSNANYPHSPEPPLRCWALLRIRACRAAL
jgi:pimeloyl-ACP methyl ester carboxylesterase